VLKTRGLVLLFVLAALLTANTSASEKSLVIDEGNSRIDIGVKATVDSFVGKLTNYSPTILVDSTTGKVTVAKVAFLFKDVKTGNEKRDREMHVWQQTGQFPNGGFSLETLDASGEGKFTARGALTFHGVTQTLSFPVTITRSGPAMTIEGDAVVDTRMFGLPIIRKFALLKVDPLVAVHFHLAGTMMDP
jgi:polyisoprenoid-binding protein YceI